MAAIEDMEVVIFSHWMRRIIILIVGFNLTFQLGMSQALLEADGPGDTYELINAVLAPGHTAVEGPDCGHLDFGRHIDEIFDVHLNKFVFRFHIHKLFDDDRCKNFDRQRNEIKTYAPSPDSLLGFEHDKVEYRWKFKLDSSFQPSASFTHLHQIKAVGGPEASMPLITLTARKGNPDKLQLRYAERNDQITIHQMDLDPMKGTWLDVRETILYGEEGSGMYEVLITNIEHGDTLFQFANNSIRTWKSEASFLRPKWGIYRSLNDTSNLKDEKVLFADFSINKMDDSITDLIDQKLNNSVLLYPNPSSGFLSIIVGAAETYDSYCIYNSSGSLLMKGKLKTKRFSISAMQPGLYFVTFRKKGLVSRPVKIILE